MWGKKETKNFLWWTFDVLVNRSDFNIKFTALNGTKYMLYGKQVKKQIFIFSIDKQFKQYLF